jgi:hypothetical protein
MLSFLTLIATYLDTYLDIPLTPILASFQNHKYNVTKCASRTLYPGLCSLFSGFRIQDLGTVVMLLPCFCDLYSPDLWADH